MNVKLIEITPYNPAWPIMFAEEAELIKGALGDNCLKVHHIGSTSVPNLMAKPKIDIIVVVDQLDKQPFAAIGYQYRIEHEMPFRLYFTKKLGKQVNLHVYEKGNPEIELNILFRDYLRSHPEVAAEYAELKQNLLTHKSAHEKNNSRSTGYNLGKNEFIKNIIKQTGFAGLCFRPCQHYEEWEEYHRIKIEQIFARLNIEYDKNHPSIILDNNYHFVLYRGTEIVTVAHVEFLDELAALRGLATDEPYKKKGYGSHMMNLIEKWVKSQGKSIIKLHAAPEAEQFYRRLGYDNMEFNDVSIGENNIDLGKLL